MGAYTIMDISRADAIQVIIGHTLAASDEKLEEVLDRMLGDQHLLLFNIVDEYTDDESICSYNKYHYDLLTSKPRQKGK